MSNNYIEQKKNTHLYFQVGENKYAVDADNVLEIMKLPALDYPQKLPNNIVGLLKYNNFVINIVDLRFYLNIEVTPYNTNNELLIVKTDEAIFGIITDKIMGILPFDSAQTDQIPFVDDYMIIEALYRYENETIFIVNLYSLETLLKNHSQSIKEYDIPSLLPQDETSKALMLKRSKDIADKSAMRLAASGSQTKNKYISLNLNQDFYCISLEYIREIIKDITYTNVPGTPDFIEGIMNLRGDYITVLNLKKFLGLPFDESQSKKSVVIVKYDEMQLALLIDKINELFEFEEMPTSSSSDSYYDCQFINEQTLYTVLNIEKIVSDKRIVVTDM